VPAALAQLLQQGVRHVVLELPRAGVAAAAAAARARTCCCSTPPRRKTRCAPASARRQLLPHAAQPRDADGRDRAAAGRAQVEPAAGAAWPGAGDRLLLAAFQRSAKRFGVKPVAETPFKLSNDPRERDLGNVRLLTVRARLRRGGGARCRRRVRARAAVPHRAAAAGAGQQRRHGAGLEPCTSAWRAAADAALPARRRGDGQLRLGDLDGGARAAEVAGADTKAGVAQQLQALQQGAWPSTATRASASPSAPGTASCGSRCCWRTATASPTSRRWRASCIRARARHAGLRRARDRVQARMRPPTPARLRAVAGRELHSFARQPGRLLSALVRPLLWLPGVRRRFQNVFGVAIAPPYETYIEYKVYLVPGLLGMVALFNGMQSSLAMVYDREMGVMRLLLTAPLPRWWILACKLVAARACRWRRCWRSCWRAGPSGSNWKRCTCSLALPVFLLAALMLGALGLVLSVYVRSWRTSPAP
jgi:hypothetical protein